METEKRKRKSALSIYVLSNTETAPSLIQDNTETEKKNCSIIYSRRYGTLKKNKKNCFITDPRQGNLRNLFSTFPI